MGNREPSTGGGRILVAEDDRFYRQILAKRLSAAGHEVSLTANGEEAWERLLEDPPELLLSDWMMPRLDGFELCKRVKDHATHGTIYCILLTAKDRVEDKVSALDGGADDYLLKPCDDNELLARVRTGLRVHRLYCQLEEVSVTDALTQLGNRRLFDQRLDEEVSRYQRSSAPMSLVLLDLDHFKEINDRHGHPVGDAVLESVGRILRQRVRTGEVAARIGGDEFAVLLPNAGEEGARAFGEWIEAALASLVIAGCSGLRVAGTVGWAQLERGWTPCDFVKAADRSLYDRKQTRRSPKPSPHYS